jgi:hypothetical protein
VDGKKVAEYAAPPFVRVTSNDLKIGRSPLSGQSLDGAIREVRISDAARYTDDFTPQPRWDADEHTVVLLHCDDGKGNVAHDSSGNGSDAQIVDGQWVLPAAVPPTSVAEKPPPPPDPAKALVTLSAPYPKSYPDAPTDRMALQYAVMEIARQAGLGYDFNTSHRNTNPACAKWVTPTFRNVPFAAAMQTLLAPEGLTYSIKDGAVVLARRPDAAAK